MRRSVCVAALAVALIGLAGCSAADAPASTKSATPPPTSAAAQVPMSPDPAATSDPAANAQAASILTACDQTMLAAFQNGEKVAGTPEQVSWWQSTGPGYFNGLETDALKQAHAVFVSSAEPGSVSSWSSDSITLTADITAWYQADDASKDQPAATVTADFGKLLTDQSAVMAGQ